MELAYIEGDVLRVNEAIQEYDPNLRLQFVMPENADVSDPPWRIIEIGRDGKEHVVLKLWRLDDENIIHRLWLCDNMKHDILVNLDRHNALVRSDRDRRFKEELGEASDLAAHILGGKNFYTASVVNRRTGERKVRKFS